MKLFIDKKGRILIDGEGKDGFLVDGKPTYPVITVVHVKKLDMGGYPQTIAFTNIKNKVDEDN